MNYFVVVVLQVLFFQIVVISIIVFILKKILDGMLIESAIKKLELLHFESLSSDPDKIIVVTHRKLKEKHAQKISALVLKRLRRAIPVVSQVDKKIYGGMMIQVKDIKIDCSLVSRLKESGMIRR